ncbi:unnamed protein product [Boreogadus saida]
MFSEPQADGLGGKQRQSEGGTLQEAGGKDDEGSVPQEACSGKETPLKAGSGEGGNLQEAGEGEVEGGSPQEEGEVEGGSPLEEGEVEGGSPLVKGEVEGGSPLVESQVEGGSHLVEGQVEGGSPLVEGLEGEPPSGRSGGGPPLDGLEGGPPPAGAEGGPPQAGAQGGPPQAGEEAGPPLEGEEWAQEPDRPRGPESVRELECQEQPGDSSLERLTEEVACSTENKECMYFTFPTLSRGCQIIKAEEPGPSNNPANVNPQPTISERPLREPQKGPHEIDWSQNEMIGGWCVVTYDKELYPGIILAKDEANSMNLNMEEKGIGIRELSCRTAAELPHAVWACV